MNIKINVGEAIKACNLAIKAYYAEKRIRYNNDIEKAMKPSFTNLWRGRKRDSAVKWLDKIHSNLEDTYWERITTTFRQWELEDLGKKLSNVKSVADYVILDDDEIRLIRDYL